MNRLAFMGARRFAGRFAAVAVKKSPEFIQESMAAAATAAAATTRRRGGRRVGLDDGGGRLIHAREPGRRYQQESSIHGKFLRLETDLGSGPGRSGRGTSSSLTLRVSVPSWITLTRSVSEAQEPARAFWD